MGNVAAAKRLLQALADLLPDGGDEADPPRNPPNAPALVAKGLERDLLAGRVRR